MNLGKKLLMTGLAVSAMVCQADVSSQGVVGYSECKTITKGQCVVPVMFNPVGQTPSRLGRIVVFDPPKKILGDTISYLSNGKVKSYKVKSYEENTNDYLLESLDKDYPEELMFSDLPWMQSFTINHNRAVPVKVTVTGEIPAEKLNPVKDEKVPVKFLP